MIHAVWGKCVCLIQSLVPLWEWKFYRPASCLLMISINRDSPADSTAPPDPFHWTMAAVSECRCVSHLAIVLAEQTHGPCFFFFCLFLIHTALQFATLDSGLNWSLQLEDLSDLKSQSCVHMAGQQQQVLSWALSPNSHLLKSRDLLKQSHTELRGFIGVEDRAFWCIYEFINLIHA